jgi:hypothetical protein
LRSTRCGCYNCAMGTQGLGGRALLGRRGGARASWSRIAVFGMSFAILPLAAGCSSSSLPSFGSSAPQAAAAPPPPPNSYGQAGGQAAYAPPPARPGYPQQAQGGNPQPASYAPAAAPPAQPPPSSDGTVGSVTSSYTSFLKAFRDPEPDAEAARASVYPQRSLADMFKSDSNQRPDPAGAGYPQQALVPAGGGGASPPPQQNAYVPHPPSTYTPSGQPYTPPPGQSGYAPPPATPQNYVPPPANPARSGQQSSAKPPTQQTVAARSKQQKAAAQTANSAQPPAPPAASAPAVAAPPAAAASRDYSDSLPYPKQSLADVFSGSTESQAQSVPRPPSTYAPQGQAASGAPAAAAPPPAADPASAGPYPKQSLFEVFSNNK